MGLLDRLIRLPGKKGLLGGVDPSATQPVFYSALDEALRLAPTERASPDQWAGTLANLQTKGVKAEEVRYSGIGEWLAQQDPNKALTRDQLLDYMATTGREKYAPQDVILGDVKYKEPTMDDWLREHGDRVDDRIASNVDDEWDRTWEDPDWEAIPNDDGWNRWDAERTLTGLLRGRESALNSGESVSQGVIDEIATLERELAPFRQWDEMYQSADTQTLDLFTGRPRGLPDEPEPPRPEEGTWMARVIGGSDDFDEILGPFDDDYNASRAARNFIADRRNEARDAFTNDAIANVDREEVIEDLLEIYPLEDLRVIESGRPASYKDYSLPGKGLGGEDYRELLITMPGQKGNGYSAPHFATVANKDGPIIAHARFHSREEGGKKILFLEEVQSDIGQQGRVKGFRRDPSPEEKSQIETLTKLRDESQKALDDKYNEMSSLQREWWKADDLVEKYRRENLPGVDMARQLRDQSKQKHLDANKEYESLAKAHQQVYDQLSELLRKSKGGPIPDMPLAQKGAWANLAMKRIARYAADNGYDEVRWTGNLSNGNLIPDVTGNAVEVTGYTRLDAGSPLTESLEYIQKHGVKGGTSIPGVVGKDVFTKPAPDDYFQRSGRSVYGPDVGTRVEQILEAQALLGVSIPALKGKAVVIPDAGEKVVHHGHPGWEFYDNILRNTAAELTKKSKNKVRQTYENGVKTTHMDMTEEFKEFLKKGLPLFMWPLFAGGAAGGLLARGGKREEA